MNADDLIGHEQRLRAVCARMLGRDEDVDEVVQETLLRALVRGPEDAAGPWLATVARNLARDRLRRAAVRRADGDVDEVPDEPTDESDPFGLSRIVPALGDLGENQAAVLLLRDGLGMTPAETAAALDLTEGSVRVLHHRARRALPEAQGTLTPGAVDAASRILAWLTAQAIVGLPMRRVPGGEEPALRFDVLEAHRVVLDALVAAATASGRADLQAQAFTCRGALRRIRGAHAAAAADLESAVELARGAGGTDVLAGALCELGCTYVKQGRHREADGLLSEVIASGNARYAARAQGLLAIVAYATGDGARMGATREALRNLVGADAHRVLHARAAEAYQARRFDEALLAWTEAHTLAVVTGNPMNEAVFAGNIGTVYLSTGDDALARHWFESAAGLARRGGFEHVLVNALHGLACLHLARWELGEAERWLAEGSALSRKIDQRLGSALVLYTEATVLHQRGEIAAARAAMARAVRALERIEYAPMLPTANAHLGALEALAGGDSAASFARAREVLAASPALTSGEVVDLLEGFRDLAEGRRDLAAGRLARAVRVPWDVRLVAELLERAVRSSVNDV